MNSPFKVFVALFLALCGTLAVNANNVKRSYPSAVNKDTVSHYYRLMDVRINADSNSVQPNHAITFTNRTGKPIAVDFSRVYELSFYLIANQNSTLKLVLHSGDKTSDTLTYNLEKSSGHYQKVIFPMFLEGIDATKITAMQLSVVSEKGKIQVDEFVFNYFDIPVDTKTGQPDLDSEVLKKEYQKYLEKNQNQIRTQEPERDDTWTKGNKSVKAK